jgi:MFS transporter, ACS family, glucarate transporter
MRRPSERTFVAAMNADSNSAAASNVRATSTLRGLLTRHVRYEVIAIIFVVMSVNQADRATLSIAGSPMANEMHLGYSQLGWLFSSFAWAYMLFQVAGGWALDRFGAKRTYASGIFLWSIFTIAIGFAPLLGTQHAWYAIFALVFLIGVAAAPCFPANSKIVAAWFPSAERGTASAIFNATQYFAAAVFSPLLAWLAVEAGWRAIFFTMGGVGLAAGALFVARMKAPLDHPALSREELDHMRAGGATLQMSAPRTATRNAAAPGLLRKLLLNRTLVGIYFAQYCISALTFFFLTWFPVYLIRARHISLLHTGLVASIPAICGFVGGIAGGVMSDWLLRRTGSSTTARKIPIYLGMAMACAIVACNFTNSNALIVLFMAIAFFGKGMGALGWAVVADTSPVAASGLNAAVFNTFGSLAGITTPLAIGFLVDRLHSFDAALCFVGAHALLAAATYALVVGKIRRIEI